MDIKTAGELPGILNVLAQMAVFETKMAELYSLCAVTWADDCQFWLDIWRDEISHALYVNNIIEIVSRKPQAFEKGRPFSASEVQVIVSSIMSTIEGLQRGEITKEKLLSIANGLENGFLEDKYSEIVKTGDLEYKTLMDKIVDDTAKHEEKILLKIKEQKG